MPSVAAVKAVAVAAADCNTAACTACNADPAADESTPLAAIINQSGTF